MADKGHYFAGDLDGGHFDTPQIGSTSMGSDSGSDSDMGSSGAPMAVQGGEGGGPKPKVAPPTPKTDSTIVVPKTILPPPSEGSKDFYTAKIDSVKNGGDYYGKESNFGAFADDEPKTPEQKAANQTAIGAIKGFASQRDTAKVQR